MGRVLGCAHSCAKTRLVPGHELALVGCVRVLRAVGMAVLKRFVRNRVAPVAVVAVALFVLFVLALALAALSSFAVFLVLGMFGFLFLQRFVFRLQG